MKRRRTQQPKKLTAEAKADLDLRADSLQRLGFAKYGRDPVLRRNDEIRRRRHFGETLEALARAYGLTRQRIHQITRGRQSSIKRRMTRWYPARQLQQPFKHRVRAEDGRVIGHIVFRAAEPPFERWPWIDRLEPFGADVFAEPNLTRQDKS